MASKQGSKGSQSGSRQQSGQGGNKQSGSQGSGSRAGSGSGTRGGTPEQHAEAGRQSHKNDKR
jgi:hypothetical protein